MPHADIRRRLGHTTHFGTFGNNECVPVAGFIVNQIRLPVLQLRYLRRAGNRATFVCYHYCAISIKSTASKLMS
jgi:hypothetical protein